MTERLLKGIATAGSNFDKLSQFTDADGIDSTILTNHSGVFSGANIQETLDNIDIALVAKKAEIDNISRPYYIAQTASDTYVPNATETQALFNNILYDTASGGDNVGYTIPEDGYYKMSCGLTYRGRSTNSSPSFLEETRIKINGVIRIRGDDTAGSNRESDPNPFYSNTLLTYEGYLNQGDYITAHKYSSVVNFIDGYIESPDTHICIYKIQ